MADLLARGDAYDVAIVDCHGGRPAMATEESVECRMRPVHPGEVLRDELADLGLSARAFAKALDIPVNRVTQILRAERGVSADTALRLARYFGTSAEFWMDLQSDYELRRARREVGPAIEQAVRPRAA
jgi:antitoxin HigA-1